MVHSDVIFAVSWRSYRKIGSSILFADASLVDITFYFWGGVMCRFTVYLITESACAWSCFLYTVSVYVFRGISPLGNCLGVKLSPSWTQTKLARFIASSNSARIHENSIVRNCLGAELSPSWTELNCKELSRSWTQPELNECELAELSRSKPELEFIELNQTYVSYISCLPLTVAFIWNIHAKHRITLSKKAHLKIVCLLNWFYRETLFLFWT